MALVDGHRSVSDICKDSSLGQEESLKRLALLKLAGIITQTERKPVQSTKNIPSPELEKMVNRLAGLFEEYLHQKSSSRMTTTRKITTTTIGDTVESR